MTDRNNSTKELRKFGLVLSGLILFFAEAVPYFKRREIHTWPWIIALILTALALLRPTLLSAVMTLWTRLGHVLGTVNTRIILGLFYFIVLVPISVIGRFSGKDKLGRKYDLKIKSYRIQSHEHDAKQMERIF